MPVILYYDKHYYPNYGDTILRHGAACFVWGRQCACVVGVLVLVIQEYLGSAGCELQRGDFTHTSVLPRDSTVAGT